MSTYEETMFKKKAGTTDKGKDYEHLYMVHLILKLILDEDVVNFHLSSNDDNFGSFDDVVVKIKFKDRIENFAIQLKHVDKKTPIGVVQLTATSGNFSIKKYCDSFRKYSQLRQNVKMVLLTNSKLKQEEIKELRYEQVDLRLAQHESNKLLNCSTTEHFCHTFEVNQTNHDEFFHNFYLYTDQANVAQLNNLAFELFKKNFSEDEQVFNEFVRFITQWSIKEGNKFKLDKVWMKHVIALCVLSPHMQPLSFIETRSTTQKEFIFKEVISNFDVTWIDKSSYERITYMWSSDIVDKLKDVTEVININKKYSLFRENLQTREDLYDRNSSKVNKLMWLLGKSPLVVEGCPQVYQAIKMGCKNLIILDSLENFRQNIANVTGLVHSINILQKLYDLKGNFGLHDEILRYFTYSLEGQKDTALEHLPQVNLLITSDHLVKMLDGPLLIGSQKEVLPPSYIERKVTKPLLDIEFLEVIDKNTVVLVSVDDFDDFQRILPETVMTEIHDISIFQIQGPCDNQIYTYRTYIPLEVFSTSFAENSIMKFHHLRYIDNGYLEWIETKNYEPKNDYFYDIDNFRVNDEYNVYKLQESQFFENSEQDINIICADPGMGKSTLMKRLKISSSSSKWTILIYARNHFSHFRQNRTDTEKFKKYVLEKMCASYGKEQEVFKIMMERNSIQLIWDGLDEVSDATLEAILTLVENFAKIGVKQWLTARSNLKTKLENTLGSLSRNMKQFDDAEQQEYIKNRLQIPEDALTETFNKIKKNIMAFPNYEILGIPLQIYMLTELFSKDKDKYLHLLDDIFTVLDLYEHFVVEKFNVFYEDKIKIDLTVEHNFRRYEDDKAAKINSYKIVAANYYLRDVSATNLDLVVEQSKNFLTEFEKEGDSVGFVSKVITSNNENDVEFSHNSYGEYFAALFLFDNDRSTARERDFISNGRYNNIRFFLDLMVCEGSKSFVAVIYKNPALLESCADDDLDQKDSIGRNVFELACAWGKEYPVLRRRNVIVKGDFKESWIINNKETGNLDYSELSESYCNLDKSLQVSCWKKLTLFLPFLCPFYKVYPYTVLFYAIRFDFLMIFECIEQSTFLKKELTTINPSNILLLAMYYRSERILRKLFSEKQYYFHLHCLDRLKISKLEMDEIFTNLLNLSNFRIDIPNANGQYLTHYASERNLHKTLDLLNKKDAEWNVADANGRMPIHYACEKGDEETLRLLIQFGVDLNLPDSKGQLPIHYLQHNKKTKALLHLLLANGASTNLPDVKGRFLIHCICENGDEEALRLLIQAGINLNLPDASGQLPVHYLSIRGNTALLQLVLLNGAKLDIPDSKGRLPIHYVCEIGNTEAVKLLVESGADLNVPDANGCLPIHYVYKSGNRTLKRLLIVNRANVKVPHPDGWMPIHRECQLGCIDIVKLLISHGTELNVTDEEGKLPIHYASEKGHFGIIELLATNGANVNIPDQMGLLPINYVCKHSTGNNKEAINVVKLLIANATKLHIPDLDGKLPIHHMCKNGDADVVRLMLANGAEVDVPDTDGRLPIHYVCKNAASGCEILQFLVEKGASVDCTDEKNMLPIHHACAWFNKNEIVPIDDWQPKHLPPGYRQVVDVIRLLITLNAEINIPDTVGKLPIHYICEQGLNDILNLLIVKGASVNIPDVDGCLPLHYAIDARNLDAVKLLVTNNAIINTPDLKGRLPLQCAYEKEHLDIMQFLLQNGARVDVPFTNGQLPIHHACKNGHLDVLKVLITNGAQANIPDIHDHNQYPIHYACNSSNSFNLASVLVEADANIDVVDAKSRLPLHLACVNWNPKTVILLVKNGAKVNIPDVDGRLPMHFACKHGDTDVVDLLVTKGAGLNIPDVDGNRPIHYACMNHWEGRDVLSFLIAKREDVNVTNAEGQLPVHLACQSKDKFPAFSKSNILSQLIRNGANMNKADVHGKLPIHYACENWNKDMVNFLVTNQVDVNIPDLKGRLPIHYICKHGDVELVKLVVKDGVEVNATDGSGLLPIHYACERFELQEEVIAFLVEKGSNVNVPDGSGKVPLHYACEKSSLVAVKLLVGKGARVDIRDDKGFLPEQYTQGKYVGSSIKKFLAKSVKR